MIELDGSRHDEQVDRIRTLGLERLGLKVLRFWDNKVMLDMEAVLEAIRRFAGGRTLTPTPLPTGEGLEGNKR